MNAADDAQVLLLEAVVRDPMRRRRKDSMQMRFETFFRDNPLEELTIDDICAKFSVHRNQARELVKFAKGHIPIESVRVVRLRGSK